MRKHLYACAAVIAAGICFLSAPFSCADEALFPSDPAVPPQPVQQPLTIQPADTPAPPAGDMLVPLAPPPTPANTVTASPTEPDPALTTFQAAMECATAVMVEHRQNFADARDAAYKAGLCMGKMQTFMLRAQAAAPSCFPKISVEEGMKLFVTWADKNPAQKDTNYLVGMENAFAASIPCLKK